MLFICIMVYLICCIIEEQEDLQREQTREIKRLREELTSYKDKKSSITMRRRTILTKDVKLVEELLTEEE